MEGNKFIANAAKADYACRYCLLGANSWNGTWGGVHIP